MTHATQAGVPIPADALTYLTVDGDVVEIFDSEPDWAALVGGDNSGYCTDWPGQRWVWVTPDERRLWYVPLSAVHIHALPWHWPAVESSPAVVGDPVAGARGVARLGHRPAGAER